MITVPVAAPTPAFKWQLSLFQFAQRTIYGDRAAQNSLILIVDRNGHTDGITDIDWDIRLPYRIVPGIHSMLPPTDTHEHFVVANVFFALRDVLPTWRDDDVVCITDADVVPLRRYTGPVPDVGTVLTCNYYEHWHMRCSRPDRENFIVAFPYLQHHDYQYMDGGFVPILIRVQTLKQILADVIDTTLHLVRTRQGTAFGWWAQMLAFQIVCHNHRIPCLGHDNTYFPGVNALTSSHYFAHYSCDPKFRKHTFPNHNIAQFPDDTFYRLVRDWYSR